MSSDEELYIVEDVVDQRRRKGVLEYLVHWQGYSNLHNSWEPASAIAHCSQLIEAFLAKKKSRSKSRSRSRGRSGGKSRSRSRSRGRKTKPGTRRSRSRSRSASRTPSQSSVTVSPSMKKQEASSPVNLAEDSSLRSRQKEGEIEQTSSVAKAESGAGNAASVTRGSVLKKRDVDAKLTETVKPISSVVTTPHPSLAVRQVQNDQKPPSMNAATGNLDDQTWIWSFADHATLAIFFLVSVCVLFFSIDRFSGLIPNTVDLRHSFGKTYGIVTDMFGKIFQETL